jgi:hypothetical protein
LVRWYKLGKVECQEIDRATGRCFGAVAAVRSSHSRCDHRRLTASTLAPKLASNSGKRQASPFPSPLSEYFSLYLTYLYLVSSRLTPHSSLLTLTVTTYEGRTPARKVANCLPSSVRCVSLHNSNSFLPSLIPNPAGATPPISDIVPEALKKLPQQVPRTTCEQESQRPPGVKLGRQQGDVQICLCLIPSFLNNFLPPNNSQHARLISSASFRFDCVHIVLFFL